MTKTARPARKSRPIPDPAGRLGSLPVVFIASMPYGAVVGVAYAPLVVGVLLIAAFSRQAKARRRRH